MARGGFPGGGNMNSMMKKVQKMQQEMARTQQEIEEKEFSSTAGGGVIEAVVNGWLKEKIKFSASIAFNTSIIYLALKEIFIPGPSISTFIVSSALPIFGLSEEILTMLSTNSKWIIL